jgi:p21-activated kinase 1
MASNHSPSPGPSRNNVTNRNDFFSTPSQTQSSSFDFTVPHTGPRPRSETTTKVKKSVLGSMIDVFKPNQRPEISKPYGPVHLTHVNFNTSTGEFTGLPKEWQRLLQESGISRSEQEKYPEAVMEIVRFYQEERGLDPWDKLGNVEGGLGAFRSVSTTIPTPALDRATSSHTSAKLVKVTNLDRANTTHDRRSDPERDARRGSFGTFGSIIRAGTNKQPKPTPDHLGRIEGPSHAQHPAAEGFRELKRHQRYDAPMSRPSGSNTDSSQQSQPTIKFDAQDIVHSYARPGMEGTSQSHQHRPAVGSSMPKKGKVSMAKEKDIIKRLQQICTAADPTTLYRNFIKVGQG